MLLLDLTNLILTATTKFQFQLTNTKFQQHLINTHAAIWFFLSFFRTGVQVWWFKAMCRRKSREWKKKQEKLLALRMCQAKAELNVKLLCSLLGNHQWMTVQTNYNYLHRALFSAYFIPSCRSLTCVLAVFFASM